MTKRTSASKPAKASSVPAPSAAAIKQTLSASGGILRLAPTWVPRSFLMPGRRLKLHPHDLYALGASAAASTNAGSPRPRPPPTKGPRPMRGSATSSTTAQRTFTLREAIAADGEALIGPDLWKKYQRWPVYSKFFDNLGPIPHHMHQSNAQAALVGQQGKPESYYFPPQLNYTGNNFPYTFFGLEPGTTKADIRRCLERWNKGTTASSTSARRIVCSPAPAGWCRRASCTHPVRC